MTLRKALHALAATQLLATASLAAQCDASLRAQIETAERVASSMHPDKPAQMRVLATDGAVYTAGEVQWLKMALRMTEKACKNSDDASAERTFNAVRRVLRTHHEMG